MAKEIQYTGNTGFVEISSAEPNLDGRSALTVLTAGSSGAFIKTVRVKAKGNTTRGMVRLFIYEGANTRIIAEVDVPALTRSSNVPSFEVVVPINYHLEANGLLKATTEKAENFYVIAEGYDWDYYGSIRPECAKYTANTGMATINSANTGMDGSGTVGTDIWNVIQANAAPAGGKGALIQSIVIKAQVSTTVTGMVRLFLYDGTNSALLTEIPIPITTKSATAHSFSHRIDFWNRDFVLEAGWYIRATTENSNAFNVIAEGLEITYPA